MEDCEIAVCQGKTRGQLWAPIAERVGRDSWKEEEEPSKDQQKTPDYPPQSFDLIAAPARVFLLHTFFKYESNHTLFFLAFARQKSATARQIIAVLLSLCEKCAQEEVLLLDATN